jgi:hypothetical protein
MRLIVTLISAALLVASAAPPAGALIHAAMYCWVPDFEIAVACEDDDEASDGDDSGLRPAPVHGLPPDRALSNDELGSERP